MCIESILKSYKKQVTYDEGDIIQQQANIQEAMFKVQSENHFKGISTSEYLKRSKNLVNSINTKQAWNPVHQDRISDEYLNYDKYEKNYSRLRDVIKNPEEATETFSLGSNLLNYVKKVDENVAERQELNYITDEDQSEIEEDPEDSTEEMLAEYWDSQGRSIKLVTKIV